MNEAQRTAELVSRLGVDRFYLFTGAGISYDPPTCLPLGDELTFDFLLSSILPENLLNKIPRDKLRPEVVLNVLCKYLGNEVLGCLRFFEKSYPNEYHKIVAQLLNKGIAQKVFTTNLDICHEKAMGRSANDKVIHLHGICNSAESILYTLDQVSSERASLAINRIKPSLEGKVVMFLGYSGRDDFDVAPALKSLSDSTYFIWLDHDPRTTIYEKAELTEKVEPWPILSCRPKDTWTYIRGDTKAFCRDFADHFNIKVSYASSTDRHVMLHEKKKDLRKQLMPVNPEQTILICSELLCYHVNDNDRVVNILGETAPPTNNKLALDYWTIRGIALLRQGKNIDAEFCFRNAIKIDDTSAASFRLLADVKYRMNDFHSAIFFINEALSRVKTNIQRAHILNIKALILQDNQKMQEALSIRNDILPIFKENGDLYGESDCLNNLAALYIDSNDGINGAKYYSKSLEIRKLINHYQGIVYSYLGLGIAHRYTYVLEKNVRYAQLAHTAFSLANDNISSEESSRDQFLVLKNKGDLLIDQYCYPEAYEALHAALRYSDRIKGSSAESFSCLLSLYELAILTKNDKSLSIVKSRLEKIEKHRIVPDKKYWYDILQRGSKQSFHDIDLDSLPLDIYRHRIIQLCKAIP